MRNKYFNSLAAIPQLICLIIFSNSLNASWLFGQTGIEKPAAEHKQESKLNSDEYSGQIITSLQMAQQLISKRLLNAPRVGEDAPEFVVQMAGGNSIVSLKELRRTKPVVLIFSSWGCDIFRESLAGVDSLYARYNKNANFAMIYIRDAHPLDGWNNGRGRINDQKTDIERKAAAVRCQQQLRLPFLMLIDSVDDPLCVRWSAWPTRVFVVGTDGKVKYAGGQGPWGYKPYRGFVHEDGTAMEIDQFFSHETLEEYLESIFPAPNQ